MNQWLQRVLVAGLVLALVGVGSPARASNATAQNVPRTVATEPAAPSSRAKVTGTKVVSQEPTWDLSRDLRLPVLSGASAAGQAAFTAWRDSAIVGIEAELRQEQAARVIEFGGDCPEPVTAYLSSDYIGGVRAKRFVSVVLTLSAYPGCAGTASWQWFLAATFNLKTGVRLALNDVSREVDEYSSFTAMISRSDRNLGPECYVQGDLYPDVLTRWTLARGGIRFWLEKGEGGRMSACGGQPVTVPWQGLKLTPVGQRVAKFYGRSGGTGVVHDCWPNPLCY